MTSRDETKIRRSLRVVSLSDFGRLVGRIEVLLQVLPASVVLVIQLVAEFLGPFRYGQAIRALEHEGLRAVGDSFRQQLGLGRGLEAARIGPVRGHDGVQSRTASLETVLLRFVATLYQPHELTHAIACESDSEIFLLFTFQ